MTSKCCCHRFGGKITKTTLKHIHSTIKYWFDNNTFISILKKNLQFNELKTEPSVFIRHVYVSHRLNNYEYLLQILIKYSVYTNFQIMQHMFSLKGLYCILNWLQLVVLNIDPGCTVHRMATIIKNKYNKWSDNLFV